VHYKEENKMSFRRFKFLIDYQSALKILFSNQIAKKREKKEKKIKLSFLSELLSFSRKKIGEQNRVGSDRMRVCRHRNFIQVRKRSRSLSSSNMPM